MTQARKLRGKMRGGCEQKRRKKLDENTGREEETPEPTYRKKGAHMHQVKP